MFSGLSESQVSTFVQILMSKPSAGAGYPVKS